MIVAVVVFRVATVLVLVVLVMLGAVTFTCVLCCSSGVVVLL